MIPGAAAVIGIGNALLATMIPALRTSRLDPGHELRPE
jgi:ABC-type lipoprotein release transport system permease subunit